MKKLLTLLFLACGMATGLWASSIPGALSGRFTINASGEKVLFSQGNLQYQASTNTWRFATNQYDYIGSANSNISDSYTGWIDLFGWGTGNNPTLSSWTYTDYSTFVDWGTNTISNGGNTANEWFSLSVEEWTYIFNTRDNASNLRGHSTVNGVNGYVILPDGFIIPDGLSFTPVTEWGSNVYNEQQWAQMETAGAVFFPASGCRASGKTIGSVGDYGGYYSCSNVNDNNVYNMSFGTSWAGPDGVDTRCYGRSVRLVRSSLQQDAEGYYLLGSADDWKDFAAIVNSGTNAAANAKMTADIDLGDEQTTIGNPDEATYNYFKGIFDGQGHTLTVHYVKQGDKDIRSPFPNISEATIKNIHITGTIESSTACQPAVIGCVRNGTSTIENVWSSVELTSTKSAWCEASGLVGCVDGYRNGHLVMTDCMVSGNVKSSGGYEGCFIGFINSGGSATVSNCLSVANFTYSGTSGFQGNYTNCYVKQFPSSIPASMQVTADQLADGTIAYKLQNNRGDMVWGQRIGTDAMPVLTNDENYRVYRSKTGGYTNNPEEAYEGIQQDGEGNYLLGCLSDWQDFAEIVNSGTNAAANAKMTADINLGDDQTMIGTGTQWSDYGETGILRFQGVFDGQGHTLTINYNATTESFTAPFRHIKKATIKNLRVTGTITTNHTIAAGIASSCAGNGDNSYIINCVSSVDIISNYVNSGHQIYDGARTAGIIGQIFHNAHINISDCIFNGSISGETQQVLWGGMVGLPDGPVTITNSLQIGSFDCSDVVTGNEGSGTFSTIWNKNINITNSYYLNALGAVQGTQATSAQLADGTTSKALQNGRAEEVWVQDPVTNQPMLAVFAGKYTVPASGLGTFSAKAAFTLPDGLDAYYCKDYDTSEGTIGVVAINGVVPAETGVLLRGEPGETYTLTTSNETPAMVTDNALVAVTEQTSIQQTEDISEVNYTNFGLSGGVFKKVNTNGGTVKANRAYLRIPTSALTPEASARGILLAWDGEPTGVGNLDADGNLNLNDNLNLNCYDLQGRRVVNPARGLYIVNGKKVVIK